VYDAVTPLAWNKKSSRGAARIRELFSLPSSPHAQRWKDLESMLLIGKHFAPGLLDGVNVAFWSGPIDVVAEWISYDDTASGRASSLEVPTCSRNGWFRP
jgi:hypothetical protein